MFLKRISSVHFLVDKKSLFLSEKNFFLVKTYSGALQNRQARGASRPRFQNRPAEWSSCFYRTLSPCFYLKYSIRGVRGGRLSYNDQGLPHPRPTDVRTRVRAANAARRGPPVSRRRAPPQSFPPILIF